MAGGAGGGGGVRTDRFSGIESVRADLSWELLKDLSAGAAVVEVGSRAAAEVRVEVGWTGATGTGKCRPAGGDQDEAAAVSATAGMLETWAGNGAHIRSELEGCSLAGRYRPLSRIRLARSSLRSSSRLPRAAETGRLRVVASSD